MKDKNAAKVFRDNYSKALTNIGLARRNACVEHLCGKEIDWIRDYVTFLRSTDHAKMHNIQRKQYRVILTREAAIRQGFSIDDEFGIAYEGARSNPDGWCWLYGHPDFSLEDVFYEVAKY